MTLCTTLSIILIVIIIMPESNATTLFPSYCIIAEP